jgi:hypothetical protein
LVFLFFYNAALTQLSFCFTKLLFVSTGEADDLVEKWLSIFDIADDYLNGMTLNYDTASCNKDK